MARKVSITMRLYFICHYTVRGKRRIITREIQHENYEKIPKYEKVLTVIQKLDMVALLMTYPHPASSTI